jgi:ribosomal protein S18 acetylase RimI-like enzyme
MDTADNLIAMVEGSDRGKGQLLFRIENGEREDDLQAYLLIATWATVVNNRWQKTDVGSINFVPDKHSKELFILMIEVKSDYRRKGFAVDLMNELNRRYSGYKMMHGGTTTDGAKLLRHLGMT